MIYNVEKVVPYHDMVLVIRLDTKKTASGLVLPQQQDRESMIAKVVEVGPGVPGLEKTVPQCEPGECWIMSRFIGEKILIDGVEHNLVKWGDCLAKVYFKGDFVA
jgi:co-chaperonin GroES (HSP10)